MIFLSSFLASLGFAFIFNVPKNRLIYAGLNGMIGGAVYKILLVPYGSNIALFFASFLIGIFAFVLAKILKSPTTTFLIAALIPLVPGGGLYNTMVHIMNGNSDLAIELFLTTMIESGCIVVGLILATSITTLFRRKNQYGISN